MIIDNIIDGYFDIFTQNYLFIIVSFGIACIIFYTIYNYLKD